MRNFLKKINLIYKSVKVCIKHNITLNKRNFRDVMENEENLERFIHK